jgi:hypothetical protein
MKKLVRTITASTNSTSLLSSGDFALVRRAGIGRDNVPYDALEVISSGDAKKHVIEVRLDARWGNWDPQYDEDGNIIPIRITYKPSGTEVSHGMRMTRDTLDDTRDYISALQDAVEFADKVNAWLADHPEWTNDRVAQEDRIKTFDREHPYA